MISRKINVMSSFNYISYRHILPLLYNYISHVCDEKKFFFPFRFERYLLFGYHISKNVVLKNKANNKLMKKNH